MLNVLPAKTPTEAVTVTFDFSNDTSATLSSPSIAKSVLVGTDPAAVGLTCSAPVVSGETVYTLVSGGIDNVSYKILCTVSDAGGQVHQSAASLTTTTAVVAI